MRQEAQNLIAVGYEMLTTPIWGLSSQSYYLSVVTAYLYTKLEDYKFIRSKFMMNTPKFSKR